MSLASHLHARGFSAVLATGVNCRARSPSVQERPPPVTIHGTNSKVRSGIPVPRQRFISVSKSELLRAVISTMFPGEEEKARQFLCLSQCLDSILHAENKGVLEDMRADFDVPCGFLNGSLEIGSRFNLQVEDSDAGMLNSNGFPDYWSMVSKLLSAKGREFKSPKVVIPGRFQHAFMKLLHNAGFEELSPGDLMLTAALNNNYLMTLPIYVDWKRAAESNAVVFRRGYSIDRQRGLLLAEKLDYLQSKLLQKLFFVISKPVGKFGIWFNEAIKSIKEKQDAEDLAKKLNFWIKNLSDSSKAASYDDHIADDPETFDDVPSELLIWVTSQKAVARYKGILSEVGPRERLLRRFLSWAGLGQSAPEHAFDIEDENHGYESPLNLTEDRWHSFLPRISLADIWKPASPKSCENDLSRIFRTAISILTSQSVLQEPAFEELILLYTEKNEGTEAMDRAEVPSLRMKIYKGIPIPDLPVIFPHKKLSFRILDAVRLDFASILGLVAYFFSYKFEDILSSPSAVVLDVIAASALVIYVFRVLLGYKQTRDRYELLVNRTLYERTVASGFGCIHFLVDASEQQQYKQAILVYATLLQAGSSHKLSTRDIAEKCEAFIYNVFQEKVEFPVEKAMETLVRLGLVVSDVNGERAPEAVQCSKACHILKYRWNSLINFRG